MAGSGGGGGGSSSGHHQHHHHVRGTPYHVRPSPLRLALVVAAVFLAFPALSAPLFRSIKGAERLPPELVLALLVAGAGAWAAAAFTAYSAWLALGLGGALAAAVAYLRVEGFLSSSTTGTELTPLGAAAPLLLAGLVSHPALAPLDPLLVLGLLAGAGSRGLLRVQGSVLPAEVSVLVAAAAVALLASPGLIGHALSRAFSPLHSTPTHALAALLSLALAFTQQPRLAAPSVLTALLTLALLIARVLIQPNTSDSTPPPPPQQNAQQNARASHWLLAGLLATLAIITSKGMAGPDVDMKGGPSHVGLAVVGLLLLGSGVAVLVSALLAATAKVWGPVRSGEFQMVTLDFLALCAYFVAPLCFVYYLAAQQAAGAFPSIALPAAAAAPLDRIRDVLAPFLPSLPLAQLTCLALLLVATQEALEESTIIWAHWLIRTYTLGALDTKRVALVARLDALLLHDPSTSLPDTLKASGVAHMNIFVSPALAAQAPDVCRALAKAGHTLGLETAAGPFAGPFTAAANVSVGHRALQALLADEAATEGGYSQGLAWYAGQGGHRNPWALWRASRLNLHFVAPAHRVVLGDNAGANLRAALDGWCRGGIVLVDVPPVGGGTRVDFGAALKDVAARAAEGGYALVGLAAVCPEVQRMVLSTED